MVCKCELSLKLYWRRFVNRKDWKPTSSSYVCIKHFEEKYYKKGKNSTRYFLAINTKPVATMFDPKKVIRNKQCYLITNLYSLENTEEMFVYIKKINMNYLSPRTQIKATCLNNSFPPVGMPLERIITMSYFTS